MGRPSKLSKEITDKITLAIRGGSYNHIAAEYAGIGQSTFYRWMEQGADAKSGLYREFWEAIKKAEADSEVARVATIVQASTTSWQAAAWLLERKSPQRWGRKDRQPVTDDDLDSEIERELEKLGTERQAEISATPEDPDRPSRLQPIPV